MPSARFVTFSLLLSLEASACLLDQPTSRDLTEDGGAFDAAVDAESGAASSLTWADPPARAALVRAGLAKDHALQVTVPSATPASQGAQAATPSDEPMEPEVVAIAEPDAPEPSAEGEAPVPPAMPGVSRCGERAICVPPVADPVAACEAALTLARVEGAYAEPSSCSEPVRIAKAQHGALRGAALLHVSEADMSEILVVVLAGERGFDRVLHYSTEVVGMNEERESAITRFAFEQLVPGGAPELHIETREKYDWGYCDGTGGGVGKRSDFGVCGLDASGQPYCLSRVPRSFKRADFDYSYETDKRTYHGHEQFQLSVRFTGSHITLRPKTGRVPERYLPLLGRHTLQGFAELRAGLY
jgi:hypothetical protein